MKNLNNKIDEVLAHQLNIKPVDVDALEEFIASGKTTFTKLENITTIHADSGIVDVALKEKSQDITLIEVLDNSKNISVKIDNMNRVT